MDLETKLFIQDVQIVELNEQLTQCRAENEQLKAKVKRLQDIATRTEVEKEKYGD